jgi:hypothetical protein
MLSGKEPIIIPARGCKFITGHPGESGWSYCGKRPVGHKSAWCEEHRAVVYGASKAKRVRKTALTVTPAAARSPISLEDPLLLS